MKRRSFLRSVGATGWSASWLGMLANAARAQAGATPLRFVVMFTGNGFLRDQWMPSSSSHIASPVLEGLGSVANKILTIHGLSGPGSHSEGVSEALTGRPAQDGLSGIATGGPSLDQLLASRWRGQTPVASLELGVFPTNDANDQISYSASGLSLPALGSPLGGFDRLFGNANQDPAVATERRRQRRSVLDSIAADLSGLQSRLPLAARPLLDEHLTLVRAQEVDLQQPFMPLQCDFPPSPSASASTQQVFDGQISNIVTALRCGLTRVATLKVGGWGGIEEGHYEEFGINNGHHNAAHIGPNDDLLGFCRVHTHQFASLCAALDAVPEGDGTLLDSTVVVWVSEMGLSDTLAGGHSRADVPVVIGGGARAGIVPGRLLDASGLGYHHFLFTLTQAFGLSDVTSFGERRPLGPDSDAGRIVLGSLFG
jgi:hypothetical protein